MSTPTPNPILTKEEYDSLAHTLTTYAGERAKTITTKEILSYTDYKDGKEIPDTDFDSKGELKPEAKQRYSLNITNNRLQAFLGTLEPCVQSADPTLFANAIAQFFRMSPPKQAGGSIELDINREFFDLIKVSLADKIDTPRFTKKLEEKSKAPESSGQHLS